MRDPVFFADFWAAYNHKVGRKELAARRFQKLGMLDRWAIMDWIAANKERVDPCKFLKDRAWEQK